MDYQEKMKQAADRERERVNAGRGGSTFNTIGGSMAQKRWDADHPKQSSSPFSIPLPTVYPSPYLPKIPRGDAAVNIPLESLPTSRTLSIQPKVYVDDWTDKLMKRIPHWMLAACAIIGGLIGFAMGSSSGGVTAIAYAIMGAFVGLMALPAVIKLTQLALRILAFAAVITLFIFLIWAFTHTSK